MSKTGVHPNFSAYKALRLLDPGPHIHFEFSVFTQYQRLPRHGPETRAMFRRRYASQLRHNLFGFRQQASLHQRSIPAHSSPSGQKAGCDRLLTIKHSDPNTTFLTITNTDTDEMIAQAKWNVYNNVVPNEADSDGGFWASEDNKEYARATVHLSDAVAIDLLTVDPKHQKRDAGRILVKWGTATVDEMGLEVTSLSTPLAKSTKTSLLYSASFSQSPAPPRLPKEEQKLYERLQASSTGAFSTPKPTIVINQAATPEPSRSSRPRINQSPHSTPPPSSDPQSGPSEKISAKVEATGKGDELHPDVRRGAKPDFEGERNPKTGEVGGPKNEPLRWGKGGDWSYNGRVTDF
ncbi:MAG: hypothetical protein Q9171_002079 [Xanthocarpia ochracea]